MHKYNNFPHIIKINLQVQIIDYSHKKFEYFIRTGSKVIYDLCHALWGGGDAELYNHNTTIMGKR